MLQTIISAIQNRHVLAFNYNGIARTVEPHAVGVSSTGKNVLRCFQTQGGHIKAGHEWDLCNLEKIINLSDTGTVFSGARHGYKKGDKGMTRIFAEL